MPVYELIISKIKENDLEEINKLELAINNVVTLAVDKYTKDCHYLSDNTYPKIKFLGYHDISQNRVDISVDMENWSYLQVCHYLLKHQNIEDNINLEDFRELSRNIVWGVLDRIAEIGEVNGIKLL